MDRSPLQRFKNEKLGVDVTKEEIIAAARATSCRVLYPTSIMTMDYRPDRVNIHISHDGVITEIMMG